MSLYRLRTYGRAKSVVPLAAAQRSLGGNVRQTSILNQHSIRASTVRPNKPNYLLRSQRAVTYNFSPPSLGHKPRREAVEKIPPEPPFGISLRDFLTGKAERHQVFQGFPSCMGPREGLVRGSRAAGVLAHAHIVCSYHRLTWKLESRFVLDSFCDYLVSFRCQRRTGTGSMYIEPAQTRFW